MIYESNEYLDEILKISDKKDILESDNPFSKYLVYIENNEVIGFCYYYDIYEKLDIAYIFVREDKRNNKIASKLLEYLINNNQDKENITLEVNENNINAIKLYEKFGFKSVAKREGYYNGIDGILMEKKLEELFNSKIE